MKYAPEIQRHIGGAQQKDSLLTRFVANVRARVENNPKVRALRLAQWVDARFELWSAVQAEQANTQLVRAAAQARMDELKRIKAML